MHHRKKKKVTHPFITQLNGLLLEQSQTGPYFLGDHFSLADIALGPFIARILATASLFEKENSFQFNAIKQNPRLAEFSKGVVSRPSFKDTYLGDQIFIDLINKRFSPKF
jgi:glutathione S-transferase